MKKITTLLTVLFLMANGLLAQLGEIKGTIKDKETNETIPGVTVYIETGGNKTGDATDLDGKYTIKPVRVGVHTVYVSALGYNTVKISDVLITSDKITFVNVDLNVSAIDLMGVVIEAKMHEIPLLEPDEPSVQHVLPKEFKRSVNRMDPIKAISGMTTGVTVAPNGKDVYIRGSRPTSTQFITDGVKSITGGIGIPGLAIGSVKVYTGGVPARYGDVSGGVIVVETKSYFDYAQKFK